MGTEDSRCGLSAKQCVPCQGGVDPLRGAALDDYQKNVDAAWTIQDEHHLHRQFKLRNFQQALELTNRIGRLAEEQGHHPEITLTWGRVTVRIWTHKIDGLHENDFILAAKIDHLSLDTEK